MKYIAIRLFHHRKFNDLLGLKVYAAIINEIHQKLSIAHLVSTTMNYVINVNKKVKNGVKIDFGHESVEML